MSREGSCTNTTTCFSRCYTATARRPPKPAWKPRIRHTARFQGRHCQQARTKQLRKSQKPQAAASPKDALNGKPQVDAEAKEPIQPTTNAQPGIPAPFRASGIVGLQYTTAHYHILELLKSILWFHGIFWHTLGRTSPGAVSWHGHLGHFGLAGP